MGRRGTTYAPFVDKPDSQEFVPTTSLLFKKKESLMNWSNEKESVAHHEAGHWVISSALGFPLDEVGIAFDKADQSWGWESKPMKVDPEKGILIAFAGPWAEILFQARKL